MSVRYLALFAVFLSLALVEQAKADATRSANGLDSAETGTPDSEDALAATAPQPPAPTAQPFQLLPPNATSPIDDARAFTKAVSADGEYSLEVYKGFASAVKARAEALLHYDKYQWMVALGALLLGAVMLYYGEMFFKYVLVIAACVACFFALYVVFMVKWDRWEKYPDMKTKWCTSDHYYGAVIVFVELSLMLAYILERAYVGIKLLFGVSFGFFLYDYVHAYLIYHFGGRFTNGWLLLALINFFGVLGYRLIASRIALLSAAIGACLMSSAIAFFAEYWIVQAQPESLKEQLVIPPPGTTLAFVDFLRVLTQPPVRQGYQDVGVFAGSKLNPIVYGHQYQLDAVIGYLIWFFLFELGAWFQKRRQSTTTSALEVPFIDKPGIEFDKPFIEFYQ